MDFKDSKGFLNNPFLFALKVQKKDINLTNFEYEDQELIFFHQLVRYMENLKMVKYSLDYVNLAIVVVLKKVLLTSFIDYFAYTKEEIKRIEKSLNLKQTNSKLVLSLAKKVSAFLISVPVQDEYRIYDLFIFDVYEQIDFLNEKIILENFKDVKITIDEITSGVKNECFINNNDNYYLKQEIKDYIKEKHQYDFFGVIKSNYFLSPLYNNHFNELSKTISNNLNFNKSFTSFINNVYEYNGFTAVKKIIDKCFENLCKTNRGKIIYDNKFPLFYQDNILDKVKNHVKEWLYHFVFKEENKRLTENEVESLIYPIVNIDNSLKGKEIFVEFLKSIYPNEFKKVLDVFSRPNELIQKENGYKRNLTLEDIIDTHLFGYNTDIMCDKSFITKIYPDFLKDENVLVRFYNFIYLISFEYQDSTNMILYDFLFDILRMINEMYHFEGNYVIDEDKRNESYQDLKEILKNYQIEIDDQYKKYYIISLLDRKSATIEETLLFPQLEMLGDAIYDMAVEEMCFYNEHKNLKLADYTSAKAQLVPARFLNLDKLYITKTKEIRNSKMDVDKRIEEGLYLNYNFNCYADSLEMIIGSLYLEFGINVAIEFTEELLASSFKELKMPQKLDFENADNSKYEMEYINKILPDLSNFEENKYLELIQVLRKVLTTLSLGTDSIEKRKKISLLQKLNNGLENKIVISYLYCGLEETINKFKQIINKTLNK